MNKAQKRVVLVAVAVIALMLVVPPWYFSRSGIPIRYTLIFMVDTRGASIDLTRLAVQCAAVAVLAFGAYVALSRKDGQ